MIKRILLESFGKFENKEIPCSSITLIYGANESGKTTVFDAILEGVCSPKGNTETGKRQRERYGDSRKVSLEFEGSPIRMQPADFLNLFAVRAGDLDLEVANNSEWISRIKAELFSGGIDPQVVADRLDYQLTSRAKGTLFSEVQELRTKKQELENELKHLQAERGSALEEERRAGEEEKQLIQLKTTLEQICSREHQFEESLKQQELNRALKDLEQVQGHLEEMRRVGEELDRMSGYSEEQYKLLLTQESSLRERENKIMQARTEKEHLSRSLREREDEIEKLEGEERNLQQLHATGNSLRFPLQDRSAFVEKKKRWIVRPGILVAAGASLILGMVLFLVLPRDLSVLGLVAGILLAGVLGIAGIRRETVEDTSRFQKAVENVAREWVRAGGDPLKESTWEGLVAAVERVEERLQNTQKRLEEIRRESADAKKRIVEKDVEIERHQQESDREKHELQHALEKAEVREVSKYLAQLERKKQKQARQKELEQALHKAEVQYGQSTWDALSAYVSAEWSRLQSMITESEMPEKEVRVLENNLREVKKQRTELEQKERTLLESVHRKKGEVSGAFRGLPEKIVVTERQLAAVKLQLAEKERVLKGAEAARDIFRTLSTDADTLLQSLSEEISREFSRITTPLKGKATSRKVNMPVFSIKETEITDAQGTSWKEGGQYLSTGTRDAFFLAARLSLARRSAPPGGRAIIVLDEPFLTLDKNRTENALRVL
ncbi:MAG TPA: AAA family ATPase, partial [Spirochaetales bacterium]|nr:AAA family ATPase [Spirochaetales bacterium]